ncbi:hypothetical protein D3C71_1696610 [compost metagenome]
MRNVQVLGCKCRDLRLLAGEQQDRFRQPQHRRGQHAVAEHDPEPHANRAADRDLVAPALGLRGHRHDGVGKAAAEDVDGEVHLRCQDDRRELRGAEPAHHQDVGRVDRKLRQLRADEGHAEIEACTIMSAP